MINIFTLTEEQKKAIDQAISWYLSDKKLMTIIGCAGSGKSTIVKYIIEAIGINPKKNVRYVTFTGKAASVLIKKKNPATTIHKLIYDPVIDPKTGLHTGEFIKKESIDSDIKLLIVDEGYLVEDSIFNDLMSFDVKVICLGDRYQLPPPKGSSPKILNSPDTVRAELTQPLRQSLDSPIIYLAEKARKHEFIKTGKYGDDVEVISKNNIDLERLKNADQIICGKNDTVKKMNQFYRRNFLRYNKDDYLPHKGEKLICLRNNWNLSCKEDDITTNLVNGLGLILENDIDDSVIYNGSGYIRCDLRPDFFKDHIFKNTPIDLLYFKYGFTKEDELYGNVSKYNYDDIMKKRKIVFSEQPLNKATFGYAITCHKSQGSEWNDVFFIFEPFANRRSDLYWQMLYTGITRASEKIVIAI